MDLFRPWRYRQCLQSIPLRVLIHGGEGASAVTRLVAAGLRRGGLRVVAKTSGAMPRLILPEGQESPVSRPDRVSLPEQRRTIGLAARERADALVVESLAAAAGEPIWRELRLIQPTHAALTPLRTDDAAHRADARLVSESLPTHGSLCTCEPVHGLAGRREASPAAERERLVGDDEIASVRWDEMERFHYVEYREHVALALRVCLELGVARRAALAGMWDAIPDPGAMNVYQCQTPRQAVTFINGFAATQSQSLGRVWETAVGRYRHQQRIALVNCREDRPESNRHLALTLTKWTPADHYVITGAGAPAFADWATSFGVGVDRIVCAERAEGARLTQLLAQRAGESALILGLGSLVGAASYVVDHFRQLCRLSTGKRGAEIDFGWQVNRTISRVAS